MTSILKYLNDNLKFDPIVNLNQYTKSLTTYFFQTCALNNILSFIIKYLDLENTCDLLERKKQIAKNLLEKLTLKQDLLQQQRNISLANKIKICPICNKNFISNPGHPEQTYCSQECAHKAQQKTERPSKEELKQLIRQLSFLEIGKKYNVSDNAIRKWCKTYNLPSRKTDIKQYSDEEWRLL